MPTDLRVSRGRRNVVTVALGRDVSEMTLKAEIRSGRSTTAPLVATWQVDVVDAATGDITLTLAHDAIDGGTSSILYTDVIDTVSMETLMPVIRVMVSEGVTDG